jgi:uncharacterized protein
VSREEFRRNLSATLAQIESMLEELPMPMAKKVREKLGNVRKLLVEQRAPRFALVGRRGSGKSSLVNALFGEPVAQVGHEKAQTGAPRWFTFAGDRGSLEFLDTRGFQEAHTPAEADASGTAVESILLELERQCPDTVIFLVKAGEVGAAIDEDLAETERILDRLHRSHGAKVPLVAVITQCDLLEPKDARLDLPGTDPRDLQEKRERVKRVETLVEDKIRARAPLRDHFVTAIGISAYQSWREDGTRRTDQRWRVDELVAFLYDKLPEQARIELVRLAQVRRLQKRMARQLTALVASLCAALAATPIPMGDIGPITSLQVALVVAIGYIGGRNLTTATATEFLGALGANVGVSFAFREAARALVKFVFPGAGTVVSAGVAFAGSWAIGEAATAYFIEGLSLAAAKRRWRDFRREGDEKAREQNLD